MGPRQATDSPIRRHLFLRAALDRLDLGGWHTQMTVVTSDILKAAQASPDEHKDLVIRVAGYSAYFTQLEKEVQDDIIDRTEHVSL